MDKRLEVVKAECRRIEAREVVSDLVKGWADPRSVVFSYLRMPGQPHVVVVYASFKILDQSNHPQDQPYAYFNFGIHDDESLEIIPLRIQLSAEGAWKELQRQMAAKGGAG